MQTRVKLYINYVCESGLMEVPIWLRQRFICVTSEVRTSGIIKQMSLLYEALKSGKI